MNYPGIWTGNGNANFKAQNELTHGGNSGQYGSRCSLTNQCLIGHSFGAKFATERMACGRKIDQSGTNDEVGSVDFLDMFIITQGLTNGPVRW